MERPINTTKGQTFDTETQKDIEALKQSVLDVKDNPCTFYSRMPYTVWGKYASNWLEFRKTEIYSKVLEELSKIPTVAEKPTRIVIRGESAA